MAYVKIYFIKHLSNALKYLEKEKESSNLVAASGFVPEDAEVKFKLNAQKAKGKGTIEAVHVIQSWNEAESRKHPAEFFQENGKEMISRHFPGYDFVVATHTETGKTHNHIVVSPWHPETGKKIENKKYHLYRLREISDDLCKSRGLTVIDQKARERQANVPDKVRRIIRFRGHSYLLDLMQKADFARAFATDYDSYADFLAEFDIHAKVQNKNITYFYPGMARGKRGSKLGKLYDKEGLSKTFEENRQRYRGRAGFGDLVQAEMEAFQKDPASFIKSRPELFHLSETLKAGSRPRSSEVLKDARSPLGSFTSERDLIRNQVPLSEIRNARSQSIIEYTQRKRIALEKNDHGELVLKGRPYVVIQDRTWINKRNRTQGNIIDFVAAYRKTTFLDAVAEINHNPRLLLLERDFGKQERTFTSFYIPTSERMRDAEAVGQISRFLKSFGASPNHATSLLQSHQAQVNQAGFIRLFPKDDFAGGWEFHEAPDGEWKSKKFGLFKKPFTQVSKKGSRLVIFGDPLTGFRSGASDLEKRRPDDSLLVLMGHQPKLVDRFLGENPHITRVEFVPSLNPKKSARYRDWFELLKRKYEPLGIRIDLFSPEKERSKGVELSLF